MQSETLTKLLQGAKFRRTDYSSHIAYFIHNTSIGSALFQENQGNPIFICWVNSDKTRGYTLVLESTLLGKRAEVCIDCSVDIELIP